MYRGYDDDFGLAPRIYRAPDEIRLDIYEAKLAIEKINERLNIRELMLGIISEGGEEMSPEELVLSLEEMVSEAEAALAELNKLNAELSNLEEELYEVKCEIGI